MREIAEKPKIANREGNASHFGCCITSPAISLGISFMDGTEGVPADGVVAEPAEVAARCQMSPPATSAVTTAENPSQGGVVVPQASSAATCPMEQKLPPPMETAPAGLAVGAGTLSLAIPAKKKRGRPRNYAPDGSFLLPLKPKPIPASLQQGRYSALVAFSKKRGRGPSSLFTKQQPRFELESLGKMVACSAGANFTPHVITVASGEDVTMKIISFSQQGPQVICILSANGAISNVTLRQPNSSGGTLTYEGRFELLSLSGSFLPNEKGGPKSRSGGMSVSFASSDGRVIGGGVAGLLVAASPVQVVVGSFLPSYQLEQKTNEPKLETSVAMPAATAAPMFTLEIVDTNSSVQGQSSTPKPNLATTSSFKGENWSASQHSSLPDTRNSATDFNIFLPGG